MGIRSYIVNKMLATWEKSDKARFANKTFPSEVCQDTDVLYLQDSPHGHLLDVYYPTLLKGQRPVLIDIHGGGFMSGDKELNHLFGLHLAKKGFLVFNLNYRLAVSGVKVTDQVQDIASATAWIRAHITQYNGDPDAVFLCGHSAGAVLATMEAMLVQSSRLRKLFNIAGNDFFPYAGLVLDCGMMTFYQRTIGYWGMRSMVFHKGYRHDSRYRNMIWREISEFTALPKTYLISNSKDELKHMSVEFKLILDEKGVPNIFNYQTGGVLGHMAVIYNPDTADSMEVVDDMVRYLLG